MSLICVVHICYKLFNSTSFQCSYDNHYFVADTNKILKSDRLLLPNNV